jgi:hypothetical protein
MNSGLLSLVLGCLGGSLMLPGTSGEARSLDQFGTRGSQILLASSAQIGAGAQNSAQNASQSSAASSAAAQSAPIAPTMAPPVAPSLSAPSFTPSLTPSPKPASTSSPTSSSMPAPSQSSAPYLMQSNSPGRGTNANEKNTGQDVQMPALREMIQQNSSSTAQEGNIESFFQVQKKDSPPAVMADQRQQQKRPKTAAGRALWHILDNAGIPMFMGNKDEDLDPRLTRNYTNPAQLSTENKNAKKQSGSNSAKQTATETVSVTKCHKIPDSELEGIEVSPTTDVRVSH